VKTSYYALSFDGSGTNASGLSRKGKKFGLGQQASLLGEKLVGYANGLARKCGENRTPVKSATKAVSKTQNSGEKFFFARAYS
jgi:hypothetical protein